MSRSALSNGLIDARAFTLPVSVAIKLPSQPMSQKLRPERERLDRVLVSRGLVASREDAARLILAGLVRVDGVVVDKAAKPTLSDAKVELTGPGSPYVGRGGEKLAGALDQFQVDPKGMMCFDVGCSTGGFTDCLLQRGAARVYAVDVGYGLSLIHI